MKKASIFGGKSRKEILSKLAGVKICPATNGLPTTMTMESFRRVCEHYQQQECRGALDQGRYKYTLCDLCQGKQLPKELAITTLPKLNTTRKRPGNAATSPGR